MSIFAHSLGSLISYDLLTHGPGEIGHNGIRFPGLDFEVDIFFGVGCVNASLFSLPYFQMLTIEPFTALQPQSWFLGEEISISRTVTLSLVSKCPAAVVTITFSTRSTLLRTAWNH